MNSAQTPEQIGSVRQNFKESWVARFFAWLFADELTWIIGSSLGALAWPFRRAAYIMRKRNGEEAGEAPERMLAGGPTNLTFLLLVIGLLAIGIVMMFSASYVYASERALGGAYAYVIQQVKYAVIGLAVMWVISHVRLEFFSRYSGFFYAVAFVLLVLVLIFPFQVEGKETFKRWLGIPGTTFSFQPSEFAKFALIMLLASYYERHEREIRTQWSAVFPFAVPGLVFALLVFLERHNSGFVIICLILFFMLFCSGAKKGWFILAGIAVAAAAVLFILKLDDLTAMTAQGEYAHKRIVVWVHLLTGANPAELLQGELKDDAWQSVQSLYAIGSGGLFGLGFGQSKQKHLYLPEPQNDFVFAVVCEELGFLRSALIILVFVVLVGVGIYIGTKCKNKFGQMAAIGFSFKVGVQAMLNFAVVTSLAPNTGISLPFFSYGGTALVMQLVEMGVILAVARDNGRRSNYALR